MLRVLVGENDVQDEFNQSAAMRGSVSWIVPKAAKPGDEALFLFNRSSFTGAGVVRTAPIPAKLGRKSAFRADVGDLELFARPVTLEEVARRIPEWDWPSYPRSFTTPPPDVEAKLRALLASNGRNTARVASPATVASAAGAGGRHSPADVDTPARWDALFPSRQRETVARALSRSILAAHALADTCWTVTLNHEFVRLNVGMPLAFTASESGCNLIVMDDPALFRALSRAGLRVRRQQEFDSAPGTVSIVFPLRSLAEVHSRAWRSHLEAMGIAASKRRATPHRGYSAELVAHLRRLGFDVPDSNCPEAVALRETRRRDMAPGDSVRGELVVEPFDPTSIEDGRRYEQSSIVRRRGQGAFREAVLRAYDFRCAVTGCEVLDVLEAAHIVPYRGNTTNHVQNGLLLRADLHVLFDVGLIDFDAGWRVRLDKSLKNSVYRELEGKPIRMPKERSFRPSRDALALGLDPARRTV